MNRKSISCYLPLLIVLFFTFASPVLATMQVSYQATDLSSQEDGLWQVDYHVTGFDTALYTGFQIAFEYGQYEDITLVDSDDANWHTLIFPPASLEGYEEDGFLDAEALALTSSNTLGGDFTVTFHYLGIDFPGDQPFSLYDDGFNTVQTGQTSPVPVPGTGLLLISGLASGALAIRKKTRTA